MADREPERLIWRADLRAGKDEPLFLALIKYRMKKDRWPDPNGNVVSSYLKDSKLHAPALDLDGAHFHIDSSTPGHAHLYLPPMKRWRMFVMLWGLRVGGVIEQGNFWWTLRRGGTFVRRPGIRKMEGEHIPYTYGMFFKIRKSK